MRECLPVAPPCFGGAGAGLVRPRHAAGDDVGDARDQHGPQAETGDAGQPSGVPEVRQSKSKVLLDNRVSELMKQNSVSLEGDLYTNALISSLSPPRPDKKGAGSSLEDARELCAACIPMLLVPIIQMVTAYSVYLHVQNNLIHMHSYPLFTAYEMFVGSNITIPLHTVEALCGSWEDQEMQDGISQGPLRTMNMPDGTVFSPDERYSLFYNLKQPTRTWDYSRLGTDRSVLDDVMFVISEGTTLNPFTPSGYSLLFVLTLSMLFFSIGREVRSIFRWSAMLTHLDVVQARRNRQMKLDAMAPSNSANLDDGVSGSATARQRIWQVSGECDPEIWQLNEDGKFEIQGLTWMARFVGVISFVCRGVVAFIILMLGTFFLVFTTLKIDLILNGLALLFLLDLGTVVYHATVPGPRQKFIDSIEPIRFVQPQSKKTIRGHKVPQVQTVVENVIPSILFPLTFVAALLVRHYQIWIFRQYFKMAVAMCLFAGPTVPFADKTMVSPVAGFCDSLLGTSCAPSVFPDESRKKHGYCIITDQTTMSFPTVQYYLDDPSVFANRFNNDGSSKSWVEWGEANPKLYESGRWMQGQYQDLLRKQCLQMYQKDIPPDDIMVDDDSGETMDGAPFMCAMEPLVEALFGDVRRSIFNKHTSDDERKMGVFSSSVRGLLDGARAAALVRDLRHPDVVAAVDACGKSKVWSPAQRALSSHAAILATREKPPLEHSVDEAGLVEHRRLRRAHKKGAGHEQFRADHR
jgi:hypothetical protein